VATRPPEGRSGDRPDATSLACPHCGARYEPLQEYCLDCGARLPAHQGIGAEARAAVARRLSWTPADWFWPVLIGLGVAVLATGAVIALGGGDEQSGADTFVATDAPTAGRSEPAGPTITPPEPTTAAGTATTPPTEPPSPPPARRLIEWPAGQNGYTVVLYSIPRTSDGRRNALTKARAALDVGLEQVGVLDSSRFSSLHPGYYVVFTGVYTALGAAQTGREAADAQGYPAAYVRPISR
jgi:hypothetical protein